ncbi:hypothetical protein [Staphylococcus xylosus]|uniref:hypothetical protein n=1 Tax=Staphylococcus xylosus TaxID=1288 RepID=UPI0016433352|nr:hypothetical protein [Staphylococcus xylosus]MEB7858028.1 hypothetical protein [Staphylococcus xylosus]
MTKNIHTSVESHLYDLFDQTKFELSELNQSKSLFINGPDSQLIKRGLDISYLQGQKRAIDYIDSILKSYPDNQAFISNFNEYATSVLNDYDTSSQKFKMLAQPTADYEEILAYHYTLMGQKFIIDSINTKIINQ